MVSPCRSCSVSFVRIPPVVAVDRRALSSPPRKVHINITTPRCIVASTPPQARTPNPHLDNRPLTSPPYLPTSSPGPILTGRDNGSSPNSLRETTPVRMEKNDSDDTVVVSTQPKIPPTTVNNTQ